MVESSRDKLDEINPSPLVKLGSRVAPGQLDNRFDLATDCKACAPGLSISKQTGPPRQAIGQRAVLLPKA